MTKEKKSFKRLNSPEAGYAEADPTSDVGGFDAAKNGYLALLHLTAG